MAFRAVEGSAFRAIQFSTAIPSMGPPKIRRKAISAGEASGGTASAEVEAFLTYLAVAKRVSASTQNQAKSAILFLYKEVLGDALPWLEGIESAKRPARLPVVLTRQEVEPIPAHLSSTVGLMIRLLYGTGMWIMECCAPTGEGCRFRARGDRGPGRARARGTA